MEAVARTIGTPERDELIADLNVHLLRLKRRRIGVIRNWKAFLWRALHNKALNWIRDERAREQRLVSLDSPIETSGERTLQDVISASDLPDDSRRQFSRALAQLPADLKEVLQMLLEENWNQSAVARRKHVHRNTVRVWVNKLKRALRRELEL